MGLDHLDPNRISAVIVIIFFAIGLHEYAHCKMADLAGDPTPSFYGRVTLNLFKHFEPVGTFMMLLTALTGYGIGWGRPAPINPKKMKNPRWDTMAAVAAGPFSNFLQAVVYAMGFRFCLANGLLVNPPDFLTYLVMFGITINLSLCFFNLVPLGPLDGHWIVGQLLPEKQQYYWYRFNRTYGGFLLIGLILISQYSAHAGGQTLLFEVVEKPVGYFFQLLTGVQAD